MEAARKGYQFHIDKGWISGGEVNGDWPDGLYITARWE